MSTISEKKSLAVRTSYFIRGGKNSGGDLIDDPSKQELVRYELPGEPSEHEADAGETDEGESGSAEVFVVPGQAAEARE